MTPSEAPPVQALPLETRAALGQYCPMRRSGFLVAAALCVLALSSCGVRAAGYGVVLWGEAGSALATGSIVPIIRDAPINSSYLVLVPGERKAREFPMGRLRFFKTKREASDYVKAFSPFIQSWAVSMKDDPPPLPIRDAASQDGKVVYKLKPGQIVKVIGRSPAPETIQQYSDYWYEVVTDDGFGGFCFGHYLRPFTTAGDPTAEAQRVMSQDPTLDRILSNTWRPDSFREMLARGTIDLGTFREDVGLFPNATDNVVRLVLPLSSLEFHYTGIQKLGESSYVFTGSDLRITVLDDQRITVSYKIKDQQVSGLYTLIQGEISDLIAAEQKRRQDIFDGLLSKGASLTSSAYGTITLADGMRFSWTGFSKLVPALIPTDAAGKGSVDFPLHAAREIAGDYDGVVTFVFERGGAAGASVSFLYKATSGGLRFTSLDRDSVSNLVVTHPAISPVVIFFTQSSH